VRAIDVFKARHRFAREIFYNDLRYNHDEHTLRTPPHPTTNSLIWVLWHVARVEDAGVTRFVTRDDQVLHSGDWNKRLRIDVEHFGFGAPREEMLQISQQIDIDALHNYWHAVIDYTMTALNALTPEILDEVLTEDEVRHVLFTEGVALPEMTEAVSIYSGWTRLEALYHFSVTHYYWHGGEVRTLEGMIRS
jgi:hypothetical protein